jgi:MFS family permease
VGSRFRCSPWSPVDIVHRHAWLRALRRCPLVVRPSCRSPTSSLTPPSHQTQGTSWFLIMAGALLGISAALLWSAQGEIMMSYPLEKDKGKAFAMFWAIFQFGTFIGSVIALAINIKSGKLQAVSTSTYVVRSIVISRLGVISMLTLSMSGLHRHHLHWNCFILPRPWSQPCHPWRRLPRQAPG